MCESWQVTDLGLRFPPLFPVTRTDASAEPLVQVAIEALDRYPTKIPHPAIQILLKFLVATGNRHAALATRDLFHSVLELLDILGANANLAAVPGEDKADKLDSIGTADAAFLPVDHQL